MARWIAHGPIDARVAAAADYLLGKQPYFEVKEAVMLVKNGIPGTTLQGLGGIFAVIKRAAAAWAAVIEDAVQEHVEKRVRAYLHQTKAYRFGKDKVDVRLFENYQDAEGRYRWQPIGAMTADELELCVLSRRKRIRAEEVRIDVYEALIAQLRAMPAGTIVEDIQGQILQAN